MTIFRILGHFLELLARKVYLITGNSHFVWMIIHLGITEFLLRYKKPTLLLSLHCIHVLKKALCYHASYHCKNNLFSKDKLNLKSLTANLAKKSTPFYFQREMNTLAYFFTGSVGFGAGGMGESDDEGSDPSKESKYDVNEEKMEVTSDHSESEKTTEDAIGMVVDTTEEPLDRTSIPQTQQKRKAESEGEKNGKRSKSVDLPSETDNCQNESRDSMREIVKFSDMPGGPCRSSFLENKLQEESVASKESYLKEGCGISTNEKYLLDVNTQSTGKARKTLTCNKIRKVIPVSSDGSETGTENTSLKDSVRETLKCSGKPAEPGPSSTHDIDYKLQGILSSHLAPNYDITSSKISDLDKTREIPKLAVKSYAHKKCRRSLPFDNYQNRKDDTCQSKSQVTVYESVKHFDKPASAGYQRTSPYSRDVPQHCYTDPSSGVTEENSRRAKKSLPAKRSYRTVSLHEPTASPDSDVKGRHHLESFEAPNIYEISPQNRAEVASPGLPTSINILRSRRIAEAAKQYFQNVEEENQEVASIEAGYDNREEFNTRSAFPSFPTLLAEAISKSTYEERQARSEEFSDTASREEFNTGSAFPSFPTLLVEALSKSTYAERKARSEEFSDTASYSHDRPSTSAETEYDSNAQWEKDRAEGKLEMRTYPGLALRPLEVKKDAFYQKKFYRQKKKIDLPVKLEESIQWAINNSEYSSSDVPHPKADDSEDDKLSLEQYHVQAQTEVQKLLKNYDDAKEREKNNQAAKDKKPEESKKQKQQGEKQLQNTGYAESSFIEESPPASDTSEGASTVKLHGSPTKPTKASSDSLSLFGVSPIKPVARIPPTFELRTIPVNLENQPGIVNIYSPPEGRDPACPALPDCVVDLRNPLPFRHTKLKFIEKGEINSSMDIFCRDTFYCPSTENESPNIPLTPFFRMKNFVPQSPEAVSIEEFLYSLLNSQDCYYQCVYSKTESFRDTEIFLNVCKIPLRHDVSLDESYVHVIPTYELDGDTLRPITSSAGHTSTSFDSCWESVLISNVQKPPIGTLSISRQHQQTRSQPADKENLKADYKLQPLQINVDEPSTSKLDTNMNVCDTGRGEIEVPEVDYVCERSPVRVLFQEKDLTPCLMTVESEEETDQQSKESEAKLETSVIAHSTESCTKQQSETHLKPECSNTTLLKFLDMRPRVEIPGNDFSDISMEEQYAIMESLRLGKQEPDDPKDQGNTVLSMEYKETPEEIDFLNEGPTLSKGESSDESCASGETAEVKIEKEELLDKNAKIHLNDESSFKPTNNVELKIENTLPASRQTQFPTIINIRAKNVSEIVNKEFYSPSSEKEIKNIENPSSSASETFSSSEKENLSPNKVQESSQGFFSFGDKNIDASAKPSTEDESENTKDLSIPSEVANLDESLPHSQFHIQDTSEKTEINQGSQILSEEKSSSESSTGDKIP